MKEIITPLILQALKKSKISMTELEVSQLIEIPPSIDLGDFALPCFSFAKKLKKSPQLIAQEISKHIKSDKNLEEIKINGPYLNFFLDRKKFSNDLIINVLDKGEDYGKSDIGKGKITMIEFSQANTHKAFHVGHIRGTSIGECLARIGTFLSEKVIRANYQGDTGMHVAKWLWCYNKFHSNESLLNNESWIASIYVEAVRKLKENPAFQEEVNKINLELEKGTNKKLINLWKKTRQLSLDSFEAIYQQLNTHFDVLFFEGDLESEGKRISNFLVKKGIATISDGATIINLEKYNLGVWVLLRKDGTVLYPSKDLALAPEKFKKYNLSKSLYIVANEQDLHMKQLFKTLELMEIKDYKKCFHLSYGMVRLPQGKMSSRTGENILYSDFIKNVIDNSKIGIKQRFPSLSKKELDYRSLAVSIAAIKYSMLKQNPNKNIIFDKNEALSFDGNTGPYLLYTYARASSILRKANPKLPFKINEIEPKEYELVKKISVFPVIVLNAYNSLNPSLLANYSYELSKLFNEFYHSCPVIGNDNESFRLSLVKAFKFILGNSLKLLGITPLEEM